MLSIPLYVFVLIYAILFAIIAILFFINLYHLAATASVTVVSMFVTIVVLASAGIVLFFTIGFLTAIEWDQTVKLFDSNWFSSSQDPFLSD